MAITKNYSKDKKICRIIFNLPKEICENFKQISVVGDFNNWDPNEDKFTQKNPDGSSSVEIVLNSGQEYQFRYLCDGEIWLNEPEADKQILTHFGDAKNSVIVV